MAVQSPEFHARLLALHLDEAECAEAEYHRFLVETARPVDEALRSLRVVGRAGLCGQWATETHAVFQTASDALRASEPPALLRVYRDQLLRAVEVFLRAAEDWRNRDPEDSLSCAMSAQAAWLEAQDLAEGLI